MGIEIEFLKLYLSKFKKFDLKKKTLIEKRQEERRRTTREQEVKFRPKSQGRIWPSGERGHSRPPHVGTGRVLGGGGP